VIARRFAIRSRRGAYVALVALTLIWGFNWMRARRGEGDSPQTPVIDSG
jgi:hypothetical protein